MQLTKLQNGSDIRGVAIQTEGGRSVDLTPAAAYAIGRAFARVLKTKLNKADIRVCMGRDSRLSGEMLCAALGAGLNAEGAGVYDAGLATTPAVFMVTVTEGFMFDGSVMATASHLPYERNGFKFFTAGGGFEKADIKEILTIAETLYADGADTAFTAEKIDFMGVYAAQLVGAIRRGTNKERPLEGMRIIIDAGNGAGGFFERDVLLPLGANTAGSLFTEPDGHFPNHAPNPEDERAMAYIINGVKQTHADLGIIFDTDVDRAGAVLSDGRELNRNRLIAMIAAIELREHPGTTIVTDSITSTGLAEFIAAHGGIHRRFMRGYRNVINEAIRLNNAGQDAQVAMETSGHGALKENYFLDDGAYLMVKLLIELSRAKDRGESLSAMIADLREPKEAREYRMALNTEDFRPYGESVIAALTDWAKAQDGVSLAGDNFEGVRVNFSPERGNGWCLLRMSLHEPLMPLNIESDDVGGVDNIANELYPVLKGFDKLDTEKLRG